VANNVQEPLYQVTIKDLATGKSVGKAFILNQKELDNFFPESQRNQLPQTY